MWHKVIVLPRPLDLSNEVLNVSELHVVQKTLAVKVETMKKVRLSTEIKDFFVFSTLTACTFGTNESSEITQIPWLGRTASHEPEHA